MHTVRGSYALIAIHFEEAYDFEQLFHQLKTHLEKYAPFGLSGNVKAEGKDTILLNYEHEYINFYDSFHPLLASILTDYIISTKEDEWLLEIIETVFYFTNEEEKHQILTIAQSILEGDRDDLPAMKSFLNRRSYIYDEFAKHLTEEANFYFEAFLTFRLRDYCELLIDCVELAIDEYMFEQEYQNMIEEFRHYIRSHRSKYSIIHVVCDEGYTFYDEHFRELTKEEIFFHLKQELVFEEGIGMEEMVLSPLVSMVPRIVHIFSDDPDDGVVLSIQAIFQERMKLFPLHEQIARPKRDSI